MDRVRAEAVRLLYAQIHVSRIASAILITYAVGASLLFTPAAVVLTWTLAPLALLLVREISFRAFRRTAPRDEEMHPWAVWFAVQQGMVGAAWGLTMVIFAHLETPLSVALTLSVLYSLGAGSVTSMSYYPAANVALIAVLFGAVAARLMASGSAAYAFLGGMSLFFGLTMIVYCRTQSRAAFDAIRVRFENVELVAALARETAEAVDARRRAETASLAKSQFLAAASHDLRQPLYALSLFSASLRSVKLDEEGRAVVDRIGDSIGAMEELFAGLLDISRLEAGTVAPRVAAMPVDDLFDRLSQVFRPIARERGLDLRFRSGGEWIRSDPVLIEQVLSNLLSNALGATVAGGVLVAARRRRGEVRLEVWDTGRGIAPADLDRIFDDFVQVANPERDRRKGLGLGLAIARRAALLLGGSIQVRSRLGSGSAFMVSQPATADCAARRAATEVAPTLAIIRDRALPLLVVEDDADVRDALSRLLVLWHVEHDCVADADAALKRLAARRYGLVLSDQRLGAGLTGLELLRQVRRLQSPPPVVLITGEFDPLLASTASREHVPVLTKPVRPQMLRALLGLEPAASATPGA